MTNNFRRSYMVQGIGSDPSYYQQAVIAICNREVTIAQLEKLRAALALFPETPPPKVHLILHQACRDAIVCQIEDLEQQLNSPPDPT